LLNHFYNFLKKDKSMTSAKPLQPQDLFQQCDPSQFSFETTDELEDLKEIIGQPRAIEAVEFGTGIQQEGYNIFALGPPGSGKHSLVHYTFQQKAASEPTPSDWCYVHNFEQDYKPRAISLPAGRGVQFQADMEQLIEDLRTSLSSAFESDEYRTRRQVIEEEFREQQEKAIEEVQKQAKEKGLALLRTPSGLVFAPVRAGEVIPPEEFQKLPQEERELLEKHVQDLQVDLQKILQQVPIWQRDLQKQIKNLNREITTMAAGGLIEELHQRYSKYPGVIQYLKSIQKDIVENAREFLVQDDSAEHTSDNRNTTTKTKPRLGLSATNRYQVNLLVDNQGIEGAPVIYEDNPTYQNLVGRIDHLAQMGALTTNFTQIKCGALLQANGGFLILDANKVLLQPYAWEALKRSLQSKQVKIESAGQMLSLVSTVSLEPEPIPLEIKVGLLGDRTVFYLLSQLDPDFNELFKVQVDFEDELPRDSTTHKLYARLIATLAHKDELRAFDKEAVACVIERSARLTGDSEKLTARIEEISSLMREADYWADVNGNKIIHASDVRKAIDAQIYRANRIQERLRENILREMLLISTDGNKIGQVNGLSVFQLGNYSFGSPTRITARVRMGRGEVIDIEREVELSGPIHSKGVLILSSYLGAKFASDRPLSLSASLVFEQSYSGVEGDSASSAELYALLSAIANVPIKQSFAVTGSVNQHGEVQVIGGVNEKIEGFFDLCKERGLTSKQGVLIPDGNVKHLMLKTEVIEAAISGKFHIYPIKTINQGIEILTGIPAGEINKEGRYPDGTINGLVQMRLTELAKRRREYNQQIKEGD
jgi:lon-related putative ATP-dependent protease